MSMEFVDSDEKSREKTAEQRGLPDEFTPKNMAKRFKSSVKEIETLFGAANFLKDIKTVKRENLWRAQLVFLSSALDYYMHEMINYGLLQIFEGAWDQTAQYKTLKIDMEVLEEAIVQGKNIDWFCKYIEKQYATKSMLSLEVFIERLGLLGISMEDVLARAVPGTGKIIEGKREELKTLLYEMHERRNIIAHQANRNPAHSKSRDIDASIQKLDQGAIITYINSVTKIVEAITKEAETLADKKKKKDKEKKAAEEAAVTAADSSENH